ncbi:MAG: ABC transporter permease subunit [Candidatus Thermoplasmatota archaeon]|nr:ABC transporter permease subunit [Candidatus Thermoplasmatota archaeon]
MNRVGEFALKRLLILAVGMIVILTAEFVILRVMPDDVANLVMPRNPSMSLDDEEVHRLMALVDKPLFEQYFEFIGDMLSGDFHYSYIHRSAISGFIYDFMGRTLILFIASLSIALLIGSFIGRLISRMRAHVSRQVASFVPLAMFCVPVIASAWVLYYYLVFSLRLFPGGGCLPYDYESAGSLELLYYYARHAALPILIISMSMIGAFALMIRDGHSRTSKIPLTYPSKNPRFMDGLFAAMPNIQFLIAMSMCFVFVIEVFFSYPGLGFLFIQSLYRFDYFVLQASFFLMAIIVFLTNFLLDLFVMLLRPGRKLDSYELQNSDELEEDLDSSATDQVPTQSPMPAKTLKVMAGLARDYLRSPVGMVALIIYLGFVVLAIIGPAISSDEIVVPYIYSPSKLFLDGATAMVAVPLLVGLMASVIGISIGIVAGLIRPYADGLVTGAMQGLVALPLVCLVGIMVIANRSLIRPGFSGYLEISTDLVLPVAALIALLVYFGFVSSRERMVSKGGELEGQSVHSVPFKRSVPSVLSWTISGLKYGMPMIVLAVFMCDFIGVSNTSSWGTAVYRAYTYSMMATGGWDYVIYPFIGMFFLLGCIFLIFDTLERIVTARFAGQL